MNASGSRPPMPARLAERPFDERRNIPVPFMNVHRLPDGSEKVDYTAIFWPAVMECVEQRLCGLCGQPLGYWIAFMGGPLSAANRAYLDPPFHEECAESALTLCPHIAVAHAKRASDNRVAEGAVTPKALTLDKAQEWVMGISRGYRLDQQAGQVFIRPAAFKRVRRFRYDDSGVLVEHGDTPPPAA